MNRQTMLYTISQAAALVGVHPNTLRNWEARGDLPVEVLRTPGGQRRYTEQHIEAIKDAMEGGNGRTTEN